MESIKQVKNRIQSIKSTMQITQSMRLVSTAKLQKARARASGGGSFVGETTKMMRRVCGTWDGGPHFYATEREKNAAAIVVIGGDRGLCGGYNINAAREAIILADGYEDARVITIGSKTRDYCRRRLKAAITKSYTGISETPFFDDAKDIAGLFLSWYDAGEIGEVYVVYTVFESMLSQKTVCERLLPLDLGIFGREPELGGLTCCEPGGEELLKSLVPFYAACFIYGAILESSMCEQSARITSMDSAVRNSEEMIDSLLLSFNKARQAAITNEIIEIASGAGVVE